MQQLPNGWLVEVYTQKNFAKSVQRSVTIVLQNVRNFKTHIVRNVLSIVVNVQMNAVKWLRKVEVR
ncbi:hypothetical protein [Paenibacillus sp. VTT E-133280]|uniref:hypothetical protein n=1 Tax=Paenibacillus sp. VTT E-133280 TaxID=1986222 RepID=UPI0035946107